MVSFLGYGTGAPGRRAVLLPEHRIVTSLRRVTNAAPLLSVIVPVHGVERYLPRCLNSVLSGSSAADLEVVVVDDRSPDRSGRIAAQVARQDPRVRVLHLEHNVGLGQARNIGVDHARGRYLWFVDGDDWLAPGAVAAVLARLAETVAVDVLVVDHAEVFPDGRVRPGSPQGALAGEPGPLLQRPRLMELSQSACTKVVRREFLDRIGLRFANGWYEDTSFSHPLLFAAERIDTVERVCYLYRQRPDGAITKSVSDRHFEVFDQYERAWQAVESTGVTYRRFRGQLFQFMIDHLLVIVGSAFRVPPHRRREFFERMADAYHRWLPPEGYRLPPGAAGLKHRLVRRRAYRMYAVLRFVWRFGGRAGRPPRPSPDAESGAPSYRWSGELSPTGTDDVRPAAGPT